MVRSTGLTLLEILISLLLLSVGVLALAKWQVGVLALNDDALLMSIAQQQLQNLAEELMLDRCDVRAWNATNQRLLPQGRGTVTGKNPYRLILHWQGHDHKPHHLELRVTAPLNRVDGL